MTAQTFADALAELTERLAPCAGEQAKAEAERIFLAAGVASRVDLYSRELVPITITVEVERMAKARLSGQLLQHVLGTQWFLEHEYRVSPAVLIPRPETEVLAQTAIDELQSRLAKVSSISSKQGSGTPSENLPSLRGLEIGLGSGILSIELLAKFPQLTMTSSEVSPEAVQVARRNALHILGPEGLKRLTVVEPNTPTEVWEPFALAEPADFLISNPPYLLKDEADADVARAEPALALWAPEKDPLHFYREIAREIRTRVKPGGLVFLELPHERAVEIHARFGGFRGSRLVADLNGRARVLVVEV